MAVTRPRLITPLAFLAALALMLVAITPALAAPSGTSASRAGLADHVSDCNLTVDAEGNLLLEGEALTGAELAAVEALLATDSSLAAAVAVFARVGADACFNVDFDEGEGGLTAVINGDGGVCAATVAVNADGDLVINAAAFASDLLGSELVALIEATAAAEAGFCAFVTVTDNAVEVVLRVVACATATLNTDDTVTITLGGIDFDLDLDAVEDTEGLLEAGVAVEVGVALFASVDLETDTVSLSAGILDIDDCDDGDAAPTASPAPTAVPTATPPVVIPDTAGQPIGSNSGPALVLAIVALLSLGAISGVTVMGRRRLR